MMRRRTLPRNYFSKAILLVFVAAALMTACRSAQSPTEAPAMGDNSSSAQIEGGAGPAVIGDGIEIVDWAYLGPDIVGERPRLQSLSSDVFTFKNAPIGDYKYEVWLLHKENGFELEWGQFMCATQPIAVVHSNHSIEFWPGEIVGEDCEAMEVFHQLTVTLADETVAGGWDITVHPPPSPE